MMRAPLLFVLVISLNLLVLSLEAQITVTVSDPRIVAENGIIHIYYDILNSTPMERFNVNLLITDGDGNEIDAGALNGDIGRNIPGGSNKHITWDLEADNIFLNEEIFFEVYATFIPQPGPALESPEQSDGELPRGESRQLGRTSLVLQSLAVPGLGLTRITGKPHWIKGVAGYGCIAGSVFLNLKARNTYESIVDYPDYTDKQSQFDLSVRQDNLSGVLAYTAVGIWVADIVWTIIGTTDREGGALSRNERGISVGGDLSRMTFTPTLTVRYRF